MASQLRDLAAEVRSEPEPRRALWLHMKKMRYSTTSSEMRLDRNWTNLVSSTIRTWLIAAYEIGDNLLDSLRFLQGASIATGRHPLGPKDLALQLCSIATGICRYVSAIHVLANSTLRSKERVATHPQAIPEDAVEQRLTSIGRIFPHLLNHLHTLSQFSGSGNLCGKVVYEFINVFRVLFQQICDLAEADPKSSQEASKTRKRQYTGRNKQRTTSPSDRRPTTSPIIMKFCKLAISMLFHLDPVKSTHRAILEGCFYLLLTRVGNVLRAFTIGGRPFGIHEDDATSGNISGPREKEQPKGSSVVNNAEVSEAQAPYLIWMLSGALRLSSSTSLVPKPSTISHAGNGRPDMPQQDSRGNDLYGDARIRLQHTLVRAVFGEQFAANFESGLELPHIPPDDDFGNVLDQQLETRDVKDWFKNEVWRLIGWDVLRGDRSWE